jgi:hypothetical protein
MKAEEKTFIVDNQRKTAVNIMNAYDEQLQELRAWRLVDHKAMDKLTVDASEAKSEIDNLMRSLREVVGENAKDAAGQLRTLKFHSRSGNNNVLSATALRRRDG